jgi:tripartite-type tricarboxylate transporter receptor subunit TctC
MRAAMTGAIRETKPVRASDQPSREEFMTSLRTLCGAVAGAAILIGTSPVSAQNWPTRSIQTISPFTAGNANDIVARIVLDQVSKQIGQSFIIENRPGGGGTLGASTVAKAEPDGYTLLLLSSSLASHVVLHKSLPYDPLKDFVPTVLFGLQPSVLVAAPSKGWKTVKDLVADARANPGKLNYASAGVGSASHIAAEKLRLAANIKAQHIPFRPIAPALPNIRDNKVVALAVSTPKRALLLPEVPTVAEAGFPSAEYLFWGGLAFPAKTPAAIVQKLNAETLKALEVPSIQERIAKLGVVRQPMDMQTFSQFYRNYINDTVKLGKDINLVPMN